jgi:hypothetical protein
VFLNLPSLKHLQEDPVWNLAVVIGMGSGGGAIVAAVVGFVDGFIGGLKGRSASSDQKDLRQ